MFSPFSLIFAFELLISLIISSSPEKGSASYYNEPFHGQRAADGSIYNKYKLTAASNYFDLGDILVVWRVKNGDTFKTKVKVTDRMSEKYGEKRKLDLSEKAMSELQGIEEGVIDVHIHKF